MTDRITTILNRVAEGVWNRRETSIGTLSQCAFCCVAPHSVHKDNCPVRLAQDELTFQEVNKSLGLLDDELEVKPYYHAEDVLLCLKDFKMRGGAVAFSEDSTYSIQEVLTYEDTNWIDYVLINNRGDKHTLPEEDISEYFIVYVDQTKEK